VTLAGSVAIIAAMWAFLTFKPIPGAYVSGWANLVAAIFVVIFGFLFVTVSSRITGLIGSSANPISGMAIATLMATSAVFLVLGWTAPAFAALALTIGGVTCVAAANAGNTSQDLKTGFLVGATPKYQQIGLMVGVLVSVFFIGLVLIGMNKGLEQFRGLDEAININALPPGVSVEDRSFERNEVRVTSEGKESTRGVQGYWLLNALGSPVIGDGKYLYNPQSGHIEVQWIQGIGSERAAAPQARLMSTVINGILTRKLPWGLVLLGVFLVIAVELLGIRSLPFAVGSYLSIATTAAIFSGGVVRWLVERGQEKHEESEVSPGSLYASGLIAAGGIMGLLGIALKLMEDRGWIREGAIAFTLFKAPLAAGVVAVITFAVLGASLYHFARKPLEGPRG